MQVYIVIDESCYHDSSYNDVIGVFDTFEGARCCIETNKNDWMKGLDRGDFSRDFNFSDLDIREEEYYIEIEDTKTGYWQKWFIEPHIVEKNKTP